MKTKTCTTCKKDKPATLEYFHKLKRGKDGLASQCIECKREYSNKRYTKIAKKQSAQCRKRKYGITATEYNAMAAGQEYKCAICKKHETTTQGDTTITLSVDHNHKTGKVRGLLCRKCNLMLGMMDDNTLLLYAAINYLDRHNEDE